MNILSFLYNLHWTSVHREAYVTCVGFRQTFIQIHITINNSANSSQKGQRVFLLLQVNNLHSPRQNLF
jgi:hypothetical protein